MNISILRNALILLFFPLALWAQPAQQPTLGLALSGGGAKGLAHIGVLQVLEEYGIYPKVITGTSMGSIVGGLYSIGYTPDELNTLARTLRWNDYFNDTYPRAFLPVEEKARADRYQLSFAIEDGKLQLPRGLIQGRKIQTLLAGLTAPVHDVTDFNNFCLTFRCVATDLETGEPVVFSSGPLRRSIRASMSIPSAFEPVEYEDRLLVDGLVVRNLPVQDALEIGSDIVIAVDVGSPLYEREEITSVINVLDQTSSFASAAATLQQRELADFLIVPDLAGYSTLSYDQADSLIARGERAARKAMPQLLAMLDSLQIRLPMEERSCLSLQRDSFYITEVDFTGDQPMIARTLRQLFRPDIPRVFTTSQLSEEIGRLYSSGFFRVVDYELQAAAEGYRLVLSATAAPAWYLRGSINYDTDYKAGLLLNLTGRNVGMRGAILSADFRLSENPSLQVDYLVYTRSNPSIGLKWQGNINFFPGRDFENNRLTEEFSFHHYETRLSFISGISRTWSMEGGLFADRLSRNRKVFSSQSDETHLQRVGLFLRLNRDTYDRTYFPTDGSLTSVWAQWTLGGKHVVHTEERPVNNLADNITLGGRLNKVFDLGRNLYLSWINSGGISHYQDQAFINLLFLGRDVPGEESFFEIMGLRYMEQPATAFLSTGVQLRTEVGQNNFIGLTYNALWYTITDFPFLSDPFNRDRYDFDWHNGIGLELGSLTTLGPVRFTTEYNLELGRFNFAMTLGYRF